MLFNKIAASEICVKKENHQCRLDRTTMYDKMQECKSIASFLESIVDAVSHVKEVVSPPSPHSFLPYV